MLIFGHRSLSQQQGFVWPVLKRFRSTSPWCWGRPTSSSTTAENDEVKILANNFPVAKGIVVVQGNRVAVEIKSLLPRAPDAR
jgi:hypothetical protein